MNTIARPRLRTPRAALASCAALLLPFLAAADSQVESGSARAALKATAHLDFKIVIPPVLSMDMADSLEVVRGAQTVAIYTNSHNATLAATLAVSDQARGNIILSSAARKIIAQNVYCAPGAAAYARLPTGSPSRRYRRLHRLDAVTKSGPGGRPVPICASRPVTRPVR